MLVLERNRGEEKSGERSRFYIVRDEVKDGQEWAMGRSWLRSPTPTFSLLK